MTIESRRLRIEEKRPSTLFLQLHRFESIFFSLSLASTFRSWTTYVARPFSRYHSSPSLDTTGGTFAYNVTLVADKTSDVFHHAKILFLHLAFLVIFFRIARERSWFVFFFFKLEHLIDANNCTRSWINFLGVLAWYSMAAFVFRAKTMLFCSTL